MAHPEKPLVRKLLHTRMRVNDSERTVRFYTDVLGLKVARAIVSPRGSKITFLRIPGSEEEIEITEFPSSGAVSVPPDLVHLAFEVDNLEDTIERLAKMNVPVTDGPTETGHSRFIFIDAPEGYEVELIQTSHSPTVRSAPTADEERELGLIGPASSPETLMELSGSLDRWIRETVAGHPGTPPEALLKLSTDPDPLVREVAAQNPFLPDEAFEILSHDPKEVIRSVLAKNVSIPEEIARALLADPSPWVRESLAWNDAIPEGILEILHKDEHPVVRSAATFTIADRRRKKG
jgi:lactoylglutathione lyase